MNTLFSVLTASIVAMIFALILFIFRKPLKFYVYGLDSGFKLKEISLLQKLAAFSQIDEPSSLFWSVSALDRSINYILTTSRAEGTQDDAEIQNFLSKLYTYRTKIQLNPEMHKGLKDTRKLYAGQQIVITLKTLRGVFCSRVVASNRELIIAMPVYKKTRNYVLKPEDWVRHGVTVYFMRQNDAAYVFETTVLRSSLYGGELVLHLAHTDKLFRSQNRKSVRCSCKIYAQMYVVKSSVEELKNIETQPGLKCLLEDISEDGALIRVGGKGANNLLVKLQFFIGETFVVMGGFVRGVAYDPEKNQSLLHFECTSLDQNMKNAILSYVYNVLPQSEKDAMDAVNIVENKEIIKDNESVGDDDYEIEL